MSFASLGLSEALAGAVEAAGYTQPTPVQQRAIPAVLQGRDLMVAAQTGTGKTGGFALPVLELLFPGGHPDREHRYGPKQPRVLVLTPTRELAAQVHDSFKVYARDLPLKSAVIFGGVGMNPQIQAVAKGIDVLVACPGRLLDLANQKAIDLSHVEILVLDEADRMLDMGFIHDVKKVWPSCRPSARTCCSRPPSPGHHRPRRQAAAKPGAHRGHPAEHHRRAHRAARVPRRLQPQAGPARPPDHPGCLGAGAGLHPYQARRQPPAEYLEKHGLPAAAIHGNKSQNARTKALADFKANQVRILVATDIAARGLDIDQLPHVVNFELPNVEEDYVHRIGRTGRAGAVVKPFRWWRRTRKAAQGIERMTKQRIPDGDLQGFDASSIEAEKPKSVSPPTAPAAWRAQGTWRTGQAGRKGPSRRSATAAAARRASRPRWRGRPGRRRPPLPPDRRRTSSSMTRWTTSATGWTT